MAISIIGKTPATLITPDGDVLTFVNDFVKYEIEAMKLYNSEVTGSEEDGGASKQVYIGPGIPINYRCLMWMRSHPHEPVEPVRYVPMVPNKSMTGANVEPIFEAINPTIHKIDMSGGAFLTFWTNFTEYVAEYDSAKVWKFKNNQLETALTGEKVYRAMCGCMIHFERMYITGGVASSTLGSVPTEVNDSDKQTYELIPICLLPHVMQVYLSDYPIIDFNPGVAGEDSAGLRRHDHASNSTYDGGYSFAVFHPGTSIPQKPWEAI